MEKQYAEKIIAEYLKPVFGFALKRCRTTEDAEDLSQEIIYKAYRALLIKDDIESPDKFIWTIAHNALSNYYRDRKQIIVSTSIDDYEEDIFAYEQDENSDEDIHRLQSEIAFLSKIQRKVIISYYFKNKKQEEIAKELDIPLGTVKWHLFEAKKDLQKGFMTMRQSGEQKFNPIKFNIVDIRGSIDAKPLGDYFRSALVKNICYCIRNEYKSINEISKELSVSPVYVEDEIEFLVDYGFVTESKKKYIINFLLEEPSSDFLNFQNELFRSAAKIFANELYDELCNSNILNEIICGQTDEPITLTDNPHTDNNFKLWSLIPFIASMSGEKDKANRIPFDEVATIRPDGTKNICCAVVKEDNSLLSQMESCFLIWFKDKDYTFWQFDSEWSNRVDNPLPYETVEKILSLFKREEMTEEECAWLCERGIVKTNGDYDGLFKCAWQPLLFFEEYKELLDNLIKIGDRIKDKHKAEFDKMQTEYVKASLKEVTKHLYKMKEFFLQSPFHTGSQFCLHCIKVLLENGKLKEPTQNQRRCISTIIYANDKPKWLSSSSD